MIFRPVAYALSFFGMSVLISVIFTLVARFTGTSGGGGASAIVPMIAAMIEGQSYFKRAREKPAKSAMWKAAVLMSAIAFAVSIAMTLVLAFTVAPELKLLSREIGPAFLAIAAIVMVLLFIAMSRLGYGLGINTQSKAAK